MKHPIRPGTAHALTLTVTQDMAAPHLGPAGAVLSTPSMIGLMEQCCREAMLPALSAGETALGAAVCITHDAACRVGDAITVRAALAGVSDARHTWDVTVEAADGRRVGAGTLNVEVVGPPARPE